MNFPKYWAQGKSNHFTAWRWSNESMEEARDSAKLAADRLAAKFAEQGSLVDRYGYPDRPLREPVLQEIRNAAGDVAAVVTRNSYGCQVLNTARAMFVDVDFPAKSTTGSFLGALFGRTAETPEQAVMKKAEDWARQRAGWNWRVYRTPAGMRLLATHALFNPTDRECQLVFDAVGADPLYRKLCQTQECFRARLTPKPWRCDTPNPPGRWPFPDQAAEWAWANWEAEYEGASRSKASCKLLNAGNGYVHDELRPLVRLHDDMTRATSSLPLA